MKDERLSGLLMISIESDMARRLDMTDMINTQNVDKVHKFVVFWTISTIQDEKSAAKSHYIKTVNGKVIAQSISFRVVSICWQGVAPFH